MAGSSDSYFWGVLERGAWLAERALDQPGHLQCPTGPLHPQVFREATHVNTENCSREMAIGDSARSAEIIAPG
jgi:hypothetical protein